MSSEEEEKKVQHDPCSKCQTPMKVLNDFSFKLNLNHLCQYIHIIFVDSLDIEYSVTRLHGEDHRSETP